MSMRRSVTAVVGALAAGAVALPLSATSATAAPDGVADSTVTLSQNYLCVYAPPGQPREETKFPAKVEVKLDGGSVSVSLNEMPNFPKMPDIFTWRAMNARMPIVLNAETDVWAEGYLNYLTPGMQDGLKGSIPTIAMPVLSGSYDTSVVDARAVQMGNLTLKATVTVGTAPKLYDTDINCGLEGEMDQAFATLQATNATCAVQAPGAASAVTVPARVTSKITVPAKAEAGRALSMNATSTVTFAGGLADALAPTDLTKIEASLKPVVTLGGKAAAASESAFTWQRRFGGRDPKGQSIDQFMTLSGNTPIKLTPDATGNQAVALAGFDGTAKLIGVAGTSSAPITCTLDSAQALGSVKVERAAAVATTTKVKATLTKKTAKLAVTVSKKADGKATVVVTGGAKKVTKTIAVKNGKAAITLKKAQVAKKGKYTVKVSFKGNAEFKKSSGKRTFRIK